MQSYELHIRGIMLGAPVLEAHVHVGNRMCAHPLHAMHLLRMACCNGHIIEQAEARGRCNPCMVARWPGYGEANWTWLC